MQKYLDPIWGYQLEYPDDWVCETTSDITGFARRAEALLPDYSGAQAGNVLFRAEFNHRATDIDPLWNQYLTKMSIMVGAKKVGSAPLALGGGKGHEAEILLPQQVRQRLWVGILSYGLTILHLAVRHPLDERADFEPPATKIVTSLRFLSHVPDLDATDEGLPLPPGYTVAAPESLLSDIDDPSDWRAFSGQASIASLQAFYLRELPHYGWTVGEMTPFPGGEMTFAHLTVQRNGRKAVLGLLPFGEEPVAGNIVLKWQ